MITIIGHSGQLRPKRLYVGISLEEAKKRYIEVFGELPMGPDAIMWEDNELVEWEVLDIWTPIIS